MPDIEKDTWTSPEDRYGVDEKQKPYLLRLINQLLGPNATLELMCGLTVGLALVPEAVAFALVAGVPPAVGLTSTVIIAFVNAVSGGRPGMACGATGALAVVVPSLVKNDGIGYLFYAVILMSIIQAALAAVNVGSLAKLIPEPVMVGFCNGLAIVIGMAQFNAYKADDPEGRLLGDAFGPVTDGKKFIVGVDLFYMILITVISFATCLFFPKLTKKVPSALMAILAGSLVEWVLVRAIIGSETRLVGDIASAQAGLPLPIWFDNNYSLPSIGGELLGKIWRPALTMAVIGLLESCMTLLVCDEITMTKGSTYQECWSQALGNLICGVLGGMGGCAMIGQTMINIGSGGRTRLAEGFAAFFLLLVLVLAYPLIDNIPISALCGVMFTVVVKTMQWDSFKLMAIAALPDSWRVKYLSPATAKSKIRRADALIVVIVTVVTCFTDLAVGVGCGVVFAALMFAKESAECISFYEEDMTSASYTSVCNETGKHVKFYQVRGTLFFGSTHKFLDYFDVDKDPDDVQLVFDSLFISDHSAVEALKKLGDRYADVGKSLTLQHLHPGSKRILRNAESLLERKVMISDDAPVPRSWIAVDQQNGHKMPHYDVEVSPCDEVEQSS